MACNKKIGEFIQNTPYVEVITHGLDGFPNTRLFGHWANDGYDVFLSTSPESTKTKEFAKDGKAAAFYRADGKPVSEHFNVTIYGNTEKVPVGSDVHDRAVELISTRSATFRDKLAKAGKNSLTIYHIKGERVKVLDFSKGLGPAAIEEFGV